jgi:hypothetical protein
MEMNDIEAKIQQRRKFTAKVLSFVEQLLLKEGTIVLRDESSDHTHVIRCLVNFADFSFSYSCGETYCGGNTIRVWHHPGTEKTVEDVKVTYLRGDRPVLDVRYNSLQLNTNGDEINLFDKGDVWQNAIQQVMKTKQQILADRKRAKSQAVRDARARQNAEARTTRVMAEAARFRI